MSFGKKIIRRWKRSSIIFKAVIVSILLIIFCISSLRIYFPVFEGNIGSGYVRSYESLNDKFANSLARTFNKYEVFYLRIGNTFIISSLSYYDENLMATCTIVADQEQVR
jgi:hypothetical protein